MALRWYTIMGKDVQGKDYKEAMEKRRKMLVEEWTQEKETEKIGGLNEIRRTT